MTNPSLGRNSPILSNPWLYFSIFLAANTLLSYGDLSLSAKLATGLLGLILPFILAALQSPSKPLAENTAPKEFLPSIPIWLWALLGAAAIFVRFYKLTTLSLWLNYDDGLWGFFALNFIHHWDWSPFYQDNSYPSLYAWGLAFLFKCFGPSIFMVWFYPALISLLAVPAGYLAARRYFSRSIAFVAGALMALDFWPIFLGRFGNQQVLTLLAECLTFWVLGGFVKASSDSGRKRAALYLGLATGLGFYIYISWVMIAVMAGLPLLVHGCRGNFERKKPFLIFLLASGLAMTPLLSGGLLQNNWRIVHDIGAGGGNPGPAHPFCVALSYIAAFFWGVSKQVYSYQPVWGGLLDPLMGSAFLIGLLEWLRDWRQGVSLWILTGLVAFFIPGILTHDLEPFRDMPLIPLFMVSCALGFSILLQKLSPIHKVGILVLLTLAIGGLDFYHLAGKYHHIWDLESTWRGYAKPIERYRAYQVLDKIRREKGPGLVYSNFTPGLCDQTLSVADHAFNAAENPDLPFKEAQWAAVLANSNYQPFLSRRFPDGKAYALSTGLDVTDGGQMLWVMPVTPEKTGVLSKWQAASQSFCCFPGRYYGILRENLAASYASYQGDPFLESCYWEKLADYDYKNSGFKETQKAIEDLTQGVLRGYPSAHLYQKLGVFYIMQSNLPEARENFKKAISAPLDLTQSRQLLDSLKNTSPPKR
jgi:hypothetical protein